MLYKYHSVQKRAIKKPLNPVFYLLLQGRRSDSVSTTGSSSSADTSNSSSNNMEDLLTSSVEGPYHFDSIYHTSETLAFQGALKELRGIVGDEPSDEVLKDILLAADMDINRAVNFYFS